jgi:nitrogen fixation NifU-like protein
LVDAKDPSAEERSKRSGSASPGPINRGLPHLDDLYREVVLDHYRHPRGRKKLDDPAVTVEGYNPTCGDQVHVALELDQGRIKAAQVDCHGCSISVASGSMMAELLVGKDEAEVDSLTESFKNMMHGHEPEAGMDMGDLEALEGVRQFPVRIKCALLAWTTLQEALAALRAKEKDAKERDPKEKEATNDHAE